VAGRAESAGALAKAEAVPGILEGRMSRTPFRSLRYCLVLALAFGAADCGGSSAEQQLLTNFFRASRVRDNATLSNISTVQFNPRSDGTVQDFDVTNVGPEQRRTLQIEQALQEVEQAKQAETEFSKRKKEYQDANMPALRRVSDNQRAKKAITGKDAEVLAAWNKISADEIATKKRSSQARAKAAAETSLAIGSLTPPGRPDVDVKGMDVEVVSKEVTVNAQVKSPDGQTTAKTMVFTFQRAISKKGGQTTEGRWLITGLKVT
jgi:hypothetical protein